MKQELRHIRLLITFFTVCLFLSGLTAMPLESELSFLCGIFPETTSLGSWLHKVHIGLINTNLDYPFIAYGFDWLAFAHFILAILFIGVIKDPVRNKWIVEFGIIACLLIPPFAFAAGSVRGIPSGWIFIDCSFGIIGILPLFICQRKITALEQNEYAIH